MFPLVGNAVIFKSFLDNDLNNSGSFILNIQFDSSLGISLVKMLITFSSPVFANLEYDVVVRE